METENRNQMTEAGDLQQSADSSVFRQFALTIGFLALTAGIVAAWRTPATGYELSIYTATPVTYWVGIGVAFTVAAAVTVVDPRAWTGRLAVLLGGLSAMSVLSLPLLRGYRFHGLADALTHLGWAEGLRTGEIDGFELLYPATHTASAMLGELAGISTEHAMLVYISLIGGIFFIFVPLSATAVLDHPRVFAIAAFSGFLILPITNVSFFLHPHTFAITSLFTPALIHFLARYLTSNGRGRSALRAYNGWAGGVLILGLGMILLHPQTTLNVILLLGGIAGAILLFRQHPTQPIGRLQPIHGIWLILVIGWIGWISQFPDTVGVAERVIEAVQSTIGGEAAPGETVDSQAASLLVVGGSVMEVFTKIFLLPLVMCLLAVYAGLRAFYGGLQSFGHHTGSVVKSFTIGGLILIPFFLMHYAGDMSHLFFRHVGFVIVLASIFGAIGIHLLGDRLAISWGLPMVSTGVVICFVVILVFSLLVVYPSPYIYNQNHHATSQEMSGYTTTFDTVDESIPLAGIRAMAGRYHSAVNPESVNMSIDSVNAGGQLADPSLDRSGPYYLAIGQVDREREIDAYRELRISASDFAAFEADTRVNQVVSSNEFALFLVQVQE